MNTKDFFEKYNINKNGIKTSHYKICKCGRIITGKTNVCPECYTSLKRDELHYINSSPLTRIECQEDPLQYFIYTCDRNNFSQTSNIYCTDISETLYCQIDVNKLEIYNNEKAEITCESPILLGLRKNRILKELFDDNFPEFMNMINSNYITKYSVDNFFLTYLYLKNNCNYLLDILLPNSGINKTSCHLKKIAEYAKILVNTSSIDWNNNKEVDSFLLKEYIYFLFHVYEAKNIYSECCKKEFMDLIQKCLEFDKDTQKQVVYISKKSNYFAQLFSTMEINDFIRLGVTYRYGELEEFVNIINYQSVSNKITFADIESFSPKYISTVINQYKMEKYCHIPKDKIEEMYSLASKNPMKALKILSDAIAEK